MDYIRSTLVISNSKSITKDIKTLFHKEENVTISNNIDSYSLVDLESTNLIIIDFSDWQLSFGFIDKLRADPWLYNQATITINNSCDSTENIRINSIPNLISTISKFDIETDLPKILNLIRSNIPLLYQNRFAEDTPIPLKMSSEINNDLYEAECFSNLVTTFLYNRNYIDKSKRDLLKVAINELLVNAIEHGNCNIGFENKSSWLARYNHISQLIDKQKSSGNISSSTVIINYSIYDKEFLITIADGGDGFDWSKFINEHDNSNDKHLNLNGRGIIMAKSIFDDMIYNRLGNSVFASADIDTIETNEITATLMNKKPLNIAKG